MKTTTAKWGSFGQVLAMLSIVAAIMAVYMAAAPLMAFASAKLPSEAIGTSPEAYGGLISTGYTGFPLEIKGHVKDAYAEEYGEAISFVVTYVSAPGPNEAPVTYGGPDAPPPAGAGDYKATVWVETEGGYTGEAEFDYVIKAATIAFDSPSYEVKVDRPDYTVFYFDLMDIVRSAIALGDVVKVETLAGLGIELSGINDPYGVLADVQTLVAASPITPGDTSGGSTQPVDSTSTLPPHGSIDPGWGVVFGAGGFDPEEIAEASLPIWIVAEKDVDEAGKSALVYFTVTSANYQQSTIAVNVRTVDKTDVSGDIDFAGGTGIYDGSPQSYEKAALDGGREDGYADGEGTLLADTAAYTYYLASGGGGVMSEGLPYGVGKYLVQVAFENRDYKATKTVGYEIISPYILMKATSGTAVTFAAKEEGYDDVAPKTITVANTGNVTTGTVWVELGGEDFAAFEVDTDEIDDIAPGESADIGVNPVTGLAAGEYAATVTVKGAGPGYGGDARNRTEVTISLSFTVKGDEGSTTPEASPSDADKPGEGEGGETGTGSGTGGETGNGTGAETGSGTGSETGSGTGTETGSETGNGTGAETGNGTGTETGSGTGSETGNGTGTGIETGATPDSTGTEGGDPTETDVTVGDGTVGGSSTGGGATGSGSSGGSSSSGSSKSSSSSSKGSSGGGGGGSGASKSTGAAPGVGEGAAAGQAATIAAKPVAVVGSNAPAIPTYVAGVDGNWADAAGDGTAWAFVLADGTKLTNAWVQIGAPVAGVVSDGSPAGAEAVVSPTYYFGADSAMATGWRKDALGSWYYFSETPGATQGQMATGWLKAADGAWYLLDATGKMLTGWQEWGGAWYYLSDGSDGRSAGTLYVNATTPDGYSVDATGAWR
jgi:hypothetical protein